MISNLDQALEQNKRLVDEAFRCTKLLGEIKDDNVALKKEIENMKGASEGKSKNPFIGDPENMAIKRKLTLTNLALSDKEEELKKVTQRLEEADEKLSAADRKSKEVGEELSTVKGFLDDKEKEVMSLKLKLAKLRSKGGPQVQADELEVNLQMKETHMALLSIEMETLKRLLEKANQSIQQLLQERNLLIENSKKWKSTAEAMEIRNSSHEQGFKILIISKDRELQQMKRDNHHYAEVIFELKSKVQHMSAMETKIAELEAELFKYKQNSTPYPANDFTSSHLARLTENMNKMEMEFQAMKNFKYGQFDGTGN